SSQWVGPFGLIPTDSRTWIAENPQALKPGVYLWTVRVEDEYRVHYVGMSTNSMTVRSLEHLSASFGVNPVYKPDELRRGRKGEFLFCRGEDEWDDVRDGVLPETIEYIREIQIFIAPIDVSNFAQYGKCELERIESALINMIRESESRRRPFLVNSRRSRVVSDPDIRVDISLPVIDCPLFGIRTPFNA
ncbi:MAG: hypothetical protein AAFX10_13790, partial [Pseudomonadota bacterium]